MTQHTAGPYTPSATPQWEKGCVAYWGVKGIATVAVTLDEKRLSLFEPVKAVSGGINVATFLDAEQTVALLIEICIFRIPAANSPHRFLL